MPRSNTFQSLQRYLSFWRSNRRCRATRSRLAESLESRSLLTSLIGAEVTVVNTLETAAGSGGTEIQQGEPQRVIVEESADDPELSQFAGLYDIDIDANRISMVYNLSDDYGFDPARVIEAGTFDRYYFQVEGLAPGEFLRSATAEPTRFLVPNVSLVNADTILVEIGPGMQIGSSFNALILIDVGETPYSVGDASVTVRSTFQSPLETSGVEVPNGGPLTATIDSGLVEFSNVGSAAEIDLTSEEIAFRFSAPPTVDPSADTYERFYFDFALGLNESVSMAVSASGSSLQPGVTVLDHDSIVVEFGPDAPAGNGAAATILVSFEKTGAEVSGRKWNDLNGDGHRSSNEPWLNGWEMVLKELDGTVVDTTYTRNIDLNGDLLIDPATEMGLYVFEGVQDGNYLVAETVREGWEQTSPTLQLIPASSTFLNWGGRNEKWVLGAGAWYFITPSGELYRWDGTSQATVTGVLVGQFGSAAYDDLSLLSDTDVIAPNVVTVQALQNVSGLNFGNYLAPPQFTIDQNHAANSVEFNWNAASADSRYDIWITDIATKRRHQVTEGVEGTSFETMLPDRRYRVWMRTEYSPGVYSAWSASQEFEFFRDPINPILPATLDAGIDATPTIQWQPQSDAVSYDLRVITQTPGGYLATQIAATSHRVAQKLPLGTHLVSVRANYSDGSRNEWSAGQTLTISGRPVVQTDGSLVWWGPVKAATEYEIWVDRVDADGNRLQRLAFYENQINELSFGLPQLREGHYALWGRAIRSEDNAKYFSNWSERVRFSVADAAGTTLGIAADVDAATRLSPLVAKSEPQTQTDQDLDYADVNRETDEKADSEESPEGWNVVREVMAEFAETGQFEQV